MPPDSTVSVSVYTRSNGTAVSGYPRTSYSVRQARFERRNSPICDIGPVLAPWIPLRVIGGWVLSSRLQIGPVRYRPTDSCMRLSCVAPTSTRNDVLFCDAGTSGIMYVEILGDTTTDGTMVPTPPRRNAEALSRWTLLWDFGWSRIVPSDNSSQLEARLYKGLWILDLSPGSPPGLVTNVGITLDLSLWADAAAQFQH
jgi:hypothetical protein